MDIPIQFAIAGVATSVGLVLFALLSQAEDRSIARESLSRLDGYASGLAPLTRGTREAALDGSLFSRTAGRIGGRIAGFALRYTPVGYIESTRRKFVTAGRHQAGAFERFLAVKVLSIAAMPIVFWFFMIGNPLALTGMSKLGAWLVTSAYLGYGQELKLNREIEARRNAVVRQLPDILDLLVISVEAGLGFEQAIDRTVDSVPGVLSDEFRRMLNEIQAGVSRADAMRAMEERVSSPELRSFVLAILQADTFGVSIGRVLRSQAEEMRIRRRQIAQEKAMKAPVKMLVPMVFCIFPALFVIVLGPAVINIKNNL
jgi:tight adherence protein C